MSYVLLQGVQGGENWNGLFCKAGNWNDKYCIQWGISYTTFEDDIVNVS